MGCCSSKTRRNPARADDEIIDLDDQSDSIAERWKSDPSSDERRSDSMTGIPIDDAVNTAYTSLRFRKSEARWVVFKIVQIGDGPETDDGASDVVAGTREDSCNGEIDPEERLSVSDLRARYSGISTGDEVAAVRTGRSSSYFHRKMRIVVDGTAAPKGDSAEADWARFVDVLPADDCRYAVFDSVFTHDDGRVADKLCFILWCPSDASNRSKMLYAASKSALTAELKGIAVMHSATETSDLDLALVASRIPGATISNDAEMEIIQAAELSTADASFRSTEPRAPSPEVDFS